MAEGADGHCLLLGVLRMHNNVSFLEPSILLLLLFISLSHCCFQLIVLISTHNLVCSNSPLHSATDKGEGKGGRREVCGLE